MKAMMGFAFFLLFLAAIAFAYLKASSMAEKNPAAGGMGATAIVWRPTVIGADSLPADSGMTLSITESGQVSGNAGCNQYTGTLSVTADSTEFSGLAVTRMACEGDAMRRESAYLDALAKVRRVEMGSSRLQLLDADGVLLVEYIPAG
ncbi:MAG: META domain-containing protein [Pseudomonadota bacterium]